MEKTNISLTKQHLQKLRQNKKETGVPTSTLIRQLLDKYFEEKDNKK
jgi:predicted DNA-binding protein